MKCKHFNRKCSNRNTFLTCFTALDGTKMRAQGRHWPQISRASVGGLCRERCTPSRTSRIGHVAAMHRLVQGQHEKALPISSELPFPPFGRRFRRLVEVRIAQRLKKLQVLLAQLKILL